MSKTLKVMSFNLRVQVPQDGVNSFFNRTDRVLAVLHKERPDIIGFQEVSDEMRKWLEENLDGYLTVGCGRDADCHGECMLIAYKKENMMLLEVKNRWLSPTPGIPGSRFGMDQSRCPRMFTSVLMKYDGVDEPFRFINTHTDHFSATVRFLSAVQLVAEISDYREKFVMTGDFNAPPETPEIGYITEKLAYRNAVDCTKGFPGTYHEFGKLTGDDKVKIDYIFTDGKCVSSYPVEDPSVNGCYYSDHNAVVAVIEL